MSTGCARTARPTATPTGRSRRCPTGWPARRAPTCSSTRRTRWTGGSGGDAAFAEAVRRDVPVLLSVGYAACHWCHVMAHESFEDGATAAFVNAHFVAIKVDREERPDVDAVYMEAVQSLTGQGGWPMTAFLTPAGRPFYAGTYFPPQQAHGMPSFRQVLKPCHEPGRSVAATWRKRRGGSRVSSVAIGCRQPSGRPVRTACRLPSAASQPNSTPSMPGSESPEVPSVDGAGVPAPAARPDRRPAVDCHGRGDLRADGPRWHVRQLAGGFARYSVDRAWVVPTSRRCSTTTPCCSGSTRTGGVRPARRSRAEWRWRRPSSYCVTCEPLRAGSRAPSTPTRRSTADPSRAQPTSGRRPSWWRSWEPTTATGPQDC